MNAHPADRFFKYVDQSGDCHLWLGGRSGRFGIFNHIPGVSSVSAQKFAYELANGPLPPRAVVTQSCHNPLCVNPSHLVAHAAEDARKIGLCGGRAGAANCINGHPLSGDNLFIDSRGKRGCRICKRAARMKHYYANKKA